MKDAKTRKDNRIVITFTDEMYDYLKKMSEDLEGNMSFTVRKIIKKHMELNK